MADTETTKTTTKPKLPPGMVIGPDGKPCKICSSGASFRAWTKEAKKAAATKSAHANKAGDSSSAALAGAGAVVAAASLAEDDPRRANCPPDVEQLGRATWTFLHTTAAYYPENPSQTQRSSMLALLRSLPTLYPCTWCADHLKDNMAQHPPDRVVDGRGPLSRWLCERHNDVNVRLGKPVFDCSKTDERWKDGPADGSCD